MNYKIILTICLYFVISVVVSQENFSGLKKVTWSEIQNEQFQVVSEDDNIFVIMLDGELVVVVYEK